jgi:MFS family permease
MSKMPSVSTKQHIQASFRDATYTNLNIGMAESYFCAFMLALGISEVIAGMGTVIPQFLGVVFQLFSIRSFFRKYSLKNRILLFLTIQALAMIPLIAIGQLKINSPVLVIGVLGLYWASLLSLNPPWNRLMGHTIPLRFRLKFFSVRNQFGQAAVFLGLLTSGLLLYWSNENDRELPTYVGIFCAGFLLKCFSWYEVKFNHNNYELPPGTEPRIRLRDFIKRLRHSEQGKLITFLFFFYVTVHFSAPYFNPYMLKQLQFNYLEYMAITAIAYFGRVFMFKILQKKAKSRHINKLLIFSTCGIATSPFWWSISQNYTWLMVVEFLSGCYWAGFELSTILLYYQKVEDQERTSVITYISFFNITGMVLGSLLGALFMKYLPAGFDQYLILFAASTFLRFLVIIFAPHVNFKGQIPKLISFNRVFNVRPPYGALSRPIIGRIKKKKDEEEENR